MKKRTGILLFTLCSVLASMTAFAGAWRTGAARLYGDADGPWTENGIVRTRNAQAVADTEGEDDMIGIIIQIGDRQFEASLLDNASAQALIAQMPLTLNMSEMNGNEKYDYLPSALPENTQSIGTIHSGDLMLFGDDCLVLFYKDFRTSFQYTRLGYVSNPSGLAEMLGDGNVQVTFSFMQPGI